MPLVADHGAVLATVRPQALPNPMRGVPAYAPPPLACPLVPAASLAARVTALGVVPRPAGDAAAAGERTMSRKRSNAGGSAGEHGSEASSDVHLGKRRRGASSEDVSSGIVGRGHARATESDSESASASTDTISSSPRTSCSSLSSLATAAPAARQPGMVAVTPATQRAFYSKKSSGVSLEAFSVGLLNCRKYPAAPVRPLDDTRCYKPTDKDVADYDIAITHAVRNGDLPELQRLLMEEGRSVNTCNRFGESILHMAARNGQESVVDLLLDNGASVWAVDDLQRTPLHDCCWNAKLQLGIAEKLLRRDPDLIRTRDSRGTSPLAYVNSSHQQAWKQFLVGVADVCWPTQAR